MLYFLLRGMGKKASKTKHFFDPLYNPLLNKGYKRFQKPFVCFLEENMVTVSLNGLKKSMVWRLRCLEVLLFGGSVADTRRPQAHRTAAGGTEAGAFTVWRFRTGAENCEHTLPVRYHDLPASCRIGSTQ